MRKIRVAMVANDLNINGISRVILHYSRSLDPERFSLTILAGSPVAPLYRRECAAAGIGLVELPARKSAVASYAMALLRAFSVQEYDIVHIHGNSATITLELLAAWLRKIPVRIAHGHNETCTNRHAHWLLLPLFRRLYTCSLACSAAAGRWMFGGQGFQVLPNSIELERYRFDPEARRQTRERLGIADRFVIGHVGRWNAQKNLPYLLEVFRMTAERDSDAVLLLVGTGPDREKIMQKIEGEPYRARIVVYGEAERTEALYAAMDVFAFPSLYEGFGIALLEAQLSGLRCVVSDAVPRDAVVSGLVKYLSVKEGWQAIWRDTLLAARREAPDRTQALEQNRERASCFDIRKNAETLTQLYLRLAERHPRAGRETP